MEINLTTDNPNPGSAPGMFWISRFSVPGRIPGKTDRNILCAKRRAALQLFHRRRSNLQYAFCSVALQPFASRHSRHQASSDFRIISVRSLNHCAAEVRSRRCRLPVPTAVVCTDSMALDDDAVGRQLAARRPRTTRMGPASAT
jgi:hypothetical protein